MMRDPVRSREYWHSESMQQEYRDLVTRLGGEAPAGGAQAPPMAPADPGPASAPGPAEREAPSNASR